MPLLDDVRKLAVINEIVRDGATNVAESFGTLAGVDTDVDIQSIAFLDPEDAPAEFGDAETYVACIDLTEPPYGVFMLVLSRETARQIAALMTGESPNGELSQLQESALQEMCNVCTSGFIDGFANTLETTIDMGTPELARRSGEEIARDQLSHVRTESIAILLDSVVEVPDREVAVELRIFLVPAPGSFVNLLDTIDADVASDPGVGKLRG